VKYFLLGLLAFSFLAFSADLFHMSYHLSKDSTLWSIAGVPLKLTAKILMATVPLFLLLFQGTWSRFLLFFFIFAAAAPSFAHARLLPSGCQNAREMMEKSGAARDAKENFFGRIKVEPPTGTFPQEMDKITWWGKFKPFEFWQSPKFQAAWIDPEGKEVMRQEFKGQHCALAKTTVKGEQQPNGQFKAGMWKVIITCEDYLIDRQTFAIMPTGQAAPLSGDQSQQSKESMMIWAKDKV
jgi:hypothetical protein